MQSIKPFWADFACHIVNLPLTSPTSGGRSVGIVRWRIKPRSLFVCCIVDLISFTSVKTKIMMRQISRKKSLLKTVIRRDFLC
jgi:hypothetical protein